MQQAARATTTDERPVAAFQAAHRTTRSHVGVRDGLPRFVVLRAGAQEVARWLAEHSRFRHTQGASAWLGGDTWPDMASGVSRQRATGDLSRLRYFSVDW